MAAKNNKYKLTSASAKQRGQVPCAFFGSARGCRNGDSCPFLHSTLSPDSMVLPPDGERSSAAEPFPRKVSEDGSNDRAFRSSDVKSMSLHHDSKPLTLRQMRENVEKKSSPGRYSGHVFVYYDSSSGELVAIDKSMEPYEYARDYSQKSLAFAPRDELPDIATKPLGKQAADASRRHQPHGSNLNLPAKDTKSPKNNGATTRNKGNPNPKVVSGRNNESQEGHGRNSSPIYSSKSKPAKKGQRRQDRGKNNSHGKSSSARKGFILQGPMASLSYVWSAVCEGPPKAPSPNPEKPAASNSKTALDGSNMPNGQKADAHHSTQTKGSQTTVVTPSDNQHGRSMAAEANRDTPLIPESPRTAMSATFSKEGASLSNTPGTSNDFPGAPDLANQSAAPPLVSQATRAPQKSNESPPALQPNAAQPLVVQATQAYGAGQTAAQVITILDSSDEEDTAPDRQSIARKVAPRADPPHQNSAALHSLEKTSKENGGVLTPSSGDPRTDSSRNVGHKQLNAPANTPELTKTTERLNGGGDTGVHVSRNSTPMITPEHHPKPNEYNEQPQPQQQISPPINFEAIGNAKRAGRHPLCNEPMLANGSPAQDSKPRRMEDDIITIYSSDDEDLEENAYASRRLAGAQTVEVNTARAVLPTGPCIAKTVRKRQGSAGNSRNLRESDKAVSVPARQPVVKTIDLEQENVGSTEETAKPRRTAEAGEKSRGVEMSQSASRARHDTGTQTPKDLNEAPTAQKKVKKEKKRKKEKRSKEQVRGHPQEAVIAVPAADKEQIAQRGKSPPQLPPVWNPPNLVLDEPVAKIVRHKESYGLDSNTKEIKLWIVNKDGEKSTCTFEDLKVDAPVTLARYILRSRSLKKPDMQSQMDWAKRIVDDHEEEHQLAITEAAMARILDDEEREEMRSKARSKTEETQNGHNRQRPNMSSLDDTVVTNSLPEETPPSRKKGAEERMAPSAETSRKKKMKIGPSSSRPCTGHNQGRDIAPSFHQGHSQQTREGGQRNTSRERSTPKRRMPHAKQHGNKKQKTKHAGPPTHPQPQPEIMIVGTKKPKRKKSQGTLIIPGFGACQEYVNRPRFHTVENLMSDADTDDEPDPEGTPRKPQKRRRKQEKRGPKLEQGRQPRWYFRPGNSFMGRNS